MTNEKILAEEKLEEVQLDAVAGGTVGELEDLAGAMLDKWSAIATIGKGVAHVPRANGILADAISMTLQRDLKIDADISLGLGGTGALSKGNKYTDLRNGQNLSHAQVIERINRAVKVIA